MPQLYVCLLTRLSTENARLSNENVIFLPFKMFGLFEWKLILLPKRCFSWSWSFCGGIESILNFKDVWHVYLPILPLPSLELAFWFSKICHFTVVVQTDDRLKKMLLGSLLGLTQWPIKFLHRLFIIFFILIFWCWFTFLLLVRGFFLLLKKVKII